MHEVFMAGDQIQNASLFSWAAKALERDPADMAGKLFVKNQLKNLRVSVFQIDGALHPKFDIVIDSKPSFLGIMANEIGITAKNNHITKFHPEEIRGVCKDLEAVGTMGGRQPPGSHLPEVFLRWRRCYFDCTSKKCLTVWPCKKLLQQPGFYRLFPSQVFFRDGKKCLILTIISVLTSERH